MSQDMENIDYIDRNILIILQQDAGISLDDLSAQVALSRNACWRRIKQMETNGTITRRVVQVNPQAVGLGLSVIVMIRAGRHDPQWLSQFRAAVQSIPEILGVHRMSGDLDYVLRLRVGDVGEYDRIYQQLIARVPLGDVSASFVMEDIKDTTALPIPV